MAAGSLCLPGGPSRCVWRRPAPWCPSRPPGHSRDASTDAWSSAGDKQKWRDQRMWQREVNCSKWRKGKKNKTNKQRSRNGQRRETCVKTISESVDIPLFVFSCFFLHQHCCTEPDWHSDCFHSSRLKIVAGNYAAFSRLRLWFSSHF